MKNRNPDTVKSIEMRLRQSAPPLAASCAARIERVCAATEALAPPRRMPYVFRSTVSRMAAASLLAAATVCLLRHGPFPAEDTGLSIPPIFLFSDLPAFPAPHRMADTLHAESDNLIGDFVTLTLALNQHTFAILF